MMMFRRFSWLAVSVLLGITLIASPAAAFPSQPNGFIQKTTLTAEGKACETKHNICLPWSFTFDPTGGPISGVVNFPIQLEGVH